MSLELGGYCQVVELESLQGQLNIHTVENLPVKLTKALPACPGAPCPSKQEN